jgi:hypothetical protein
LLLEDGWYYFNFSNPTSSIPINIASLARTIKAHNIIYF